MKQNLKTTDKFSIVCPIKDEEDLIHRTLYSIYSVGASEVVLCFDDPPHMGALNLAKRIVKEVKKECITKIIFVKNSPEWKYHQANVRRSGFRKVTYDKVLTTDIDIIINKNVLKAVKMVGEKNIGLCSCSKFLFPKNLKGLIRSFGSNTFRRLYVFVIRYLYGKYVSSTNFTGLYAFYKPYWIETEDSEALKKLTSLKGKGLTSTSYFTMVPAGEDTYLHDAMINKYKAVYLPDVGGICLREFMHMHPRVQFEKGRYAFDHERSLLSTIIQTFANTSPHFFRGYLYEKLRSKKNRLNRHFNF